MPATSNKLISTPGALPVTIVAGYLGSGKTTLINQVLNNAGGCKYAVLVNDFGELAIDAQLIDSADDNIINLSGGCVCCSYGNDLTSAMMQLDTSAFDHVVIESSGVALPGAIAASLSLHAEFTVSSILVLVDCTAIKSLATDKYLADTIERQLQSADVILVNKTNLLTAEEVAAVTTWLCDCYPTKPWAIDGLTDDYATGLLLLDHSMNHVGSSNADAAHQTHKTSIYTTFTLNLSGAHEVEKIAQRLAQSDLGLIRVKGFISDLEGRMWVIQIVGSRCTTHLAPHGVTAGLVCIGLTTDGCSKAVVERAISANPPINT